MTKARRREKQPCRHCGGPVTGQRLVYCSAECREKGEHRHTVPHIERAAELFKSGKTYLEIAAVMTAETGNPWTKNTVARTIANARRRKMLTAETPMEPRAARSTAAFETTAGALYRERRIPEVPRLACQEQPMTQEEIAGARAMGAVLGIRTELLR